MKQLAIKEEYILYFIDDENGAETPRVNERFSGNQYSVERNKINYRLRKMEKMGLVKSKNIEQNKGSAQPTKYWEPDKNKIEMYEREHGDLSIPPFIHAEELKERVDRIEDRLEKQESHISSLQSKVEYNHHYVRQLIKVVTDKLGHKLSSWKQQ